MKWRILSGMVILSSAVLFAAAVFIWERRKRRYLSEKQCGDSSPQKPLLDISDYTVHVFEDDYKCEDYFSCKIEESYRFLGLDCEWVSYPRQDKETPVCAVALLQLAFPNKECALVRLCKIRKVTPSLAKILQDRSILKFGVGISNDVKRLMEGFSINTIGTVDLRNLALRCGIRSNSSLASLTNQIIDRDLDKTSGITCSNWEVDKLSSEQINYAACDAIAGLLIFKSLVLRKINHRRWNSGHLSTENSAITGDETRGERDDGEHTDEVLEESTADLEKSGSCTTFVHRNQSISEVDILLTDQGISCASDLCQGIIDVTFKGSGNRRSSQMNIDGSFPAGRTSAYSLRQTPLYHNCQLRAPDGTLLSTVDIKKIEWYINRGLGVLECEDPPTVRLLFEPSGKPNKDREYYLIEKQNICVVCGRKDSYIRKNIIPHEYRKYFPKHLKEHLSHDVLLLCVSCHQISSRHDSFMRQQIALDYNVPLDASTQKFHNDPDCIRRRSLARAVLGQSEMPEKRRKEVLEVLAAHFQCEIDEITTEMMEELANMDTRSVNRDYVSHGEMVVGAVGESEGIVEFQRRWRQHFLDTMKPAYLPKLWSVDHNPNFDS